MTEIAYRIKCIVTIYRYNMVTMHLILFCPKPVRRKLDYNYVNALYYSLIESVKHLYFP